MTTQPHVLYRFWDTDHQLLYVGITLDPGSRWRAHRRRSWWHDVANITLEIYPNRAAVLAAETTAIRTEHPLHNVAQSAPPASQAAAQLWRDQQRPSEPDEELTPAEIAQIRRALAIPNHFGRVL